MTTWKDKRIEAMNRKNIKANPKAAKATYRSIIWMNIML
jgi:hypothetical protein